MKLADLVIAADRMVIFTGAGISTESGIPDYRSPGGLWTKMQPILFDEYISSEEARRESWRRRFAGAADVLSFAKPNAGHYAVAALVAAGRAQTVITQNIDNLHQDSGVPEGKVIELHGNATYAKCLDCGTRVEIADIRVEWEIHGEAGPCLCGGLVKAATISFGQPMPEAEMTRARDEALSCDLMLAIGSSLTVYPAAALPLIARKNGARLAILNREPTELDRYANLVINDEIGPILEGLVAELGLPSGKP